MERCFFFSLITVEIKEEFIFFFISLLGVIFSRWVGFFVFYMWFFCLVYSDCFSCWYFFENRKGEGCKKMLRIVSFYFLDSDLGNVFGIFFYLFWVYL